MQIRALIKRLSWKETIRLSWILLKKPLFIISTLKATRDTISICNTYYGKEHHLTGKANAFRHALWNILLCIRVFAISKNKNVSVHWAKKITDLHEELAPNTALDKAMDLYNNAVGRDMFTKYADLSQEAYLQFLKKKVDNALPVVTLENIPKLKEELIYIA